MRQIFGSMFIFGFSYLILCLQVSSAFPPLYGGRKGWRAEIVKEIMQEDGLRLRIGAAMMFGMVAQIMLLGATNWSVFFLPAALLSFLAGLYLRRELYRASGGPLPWLADFWPLRYWLAKWPMLAFDLWTVGLASVIPVLRFIKASG